ncbi:hypothetical protein NM208_g12586 [Fusarium decemcellulare]|uniref:Uncharacterized protein n=1 Tax=Fusarium decemcellulare TaxID=57161 RepID=A0ACC1RPX4_9HYPO|nr:hypothetical protein NM208_g12586 [Fusarium decemcellulare]
MMLTLAEAEATMPSSRAILVQPNGEPTPAQQEVVISAPSGQTYLRMLLHILLLKAVPLAQAVMDRSTLDLQAQASCQTPKPIKLWPGFPWPQTTDPFPGSASWSAVLVARAGPSPG